MGNVKTMLLRKKNNWIFVKFILTVLFITNCSSNNNTEVSKKTDLEMYKSALSLSLIEEHGKAALEFDALNLNYPYSSLTARAEVMTAYSLYQNNEIKIASLFRNESIS